MKKIGWVLPDGEYQSGSGGLKTVFDHIGCIANEYQQIVYVNTEKSAEFTHKQLKDYPNITIASSYSAIEPEFDLLIATHNTTARIVRDNEAEKKAYFIQDFEPYFYPAGDGHFRAAESYSYRFNHITMGKFLAELAPIKNGKVHVIDFCADLNIYKNLNLPREKAVCFTFQPEKPWRCAELGLEALTILKNKMPDVSIYLYGSGIEQDYHGFINLGLLSIEECNKLYNICMLGICFSPTNPSRIPFEFMAAGLPVLDLDLKNKQDFPDILYTAPVNAEAIAKTIENALYNQADLKKKSEYGLNFMAGRPLELAYDQFQKAIEEVLND